MCLPEPKLRWDDVCEYAMAGEIKNGGKGVKGEGVG